LHNKLCGNLGFFYIGLDYSKIEMRGTYLHMQKLLSWIAVFFWMSVIFYLSHQPAAESSELSGRVTEVIVDTIKTVAPQVRVEKQDLHKIVRKNAHFLYYFVFGILAANAFRMSGVGGFRGILLALLICVLYAISDEIHQIFVPGRSGEFRDVIIDSSGGGTGILIYFVVSRICEKMKKRSQV